MDIEEFKLNFALFRKMLQKYESERFVSLCLNILNCTFELSAYRQNRKKRTIGRTGKFGQFEELRLTTKGIDDDDFFRIFFLTHYDKRIEIACTDDYSKIIWIVADYVKLKEKQIKKFDSNDSGNIIFASFINGKLIEDDNLFNAVDYDKLLTKRSAFCGIWYNYKENTAYKLISDGQIKIYKECLYDNEITGQWFLEENIIHIQKSIDYEQLNNSFYHCYRITETDNQLLMTNLFSNETFQFFENNNSNILKWENNDTIEFDIDFGN